MPDFQQQAHTPHQYSTPPHRSSSLHHQSTHFTHESATARPHPTQAYAYNSSNPYARQEQLNCTLEEAQQRQVADDNQQNTASTIAAVVKIIRPRDILLSDGSNYQRWVRRLRELALQFIYNPEFFTKPTSNIHSNKVGRAIILHSVNASLKDKVSNFQTCFKAMKNLRTRFCSVCRLAQISTFLRLLLVEPDSFENTAAYAV
jgi:hypothetical protein